MAAPSDSTIEDLNGAWALDKALSSETDPLLALQGMNWVVRKAIGMSTVILKFKQYRGHSAVSSKPVDMIEVAQSTTSGLPGTTETRVLDWSENQQQDHIFGLCIVQARWIRGSKGLDGKVRPNVEVQTEIEDELIAKFLEGNISEDGGECDGYTVEEPISHAFEEEEEYGLWVQLFIRNQNNGWTAEQIWGFEMINGERRSTRRTVIKDKNGRYRMARMVYNFIDRDTKK